MVKQVRKYRKYPKRKVYRSKMSMPRQVREDAIVNTGGTSIINPSTRDKTITMVYTIENAKLFSYVGSAYTNQYGAIQFKISDLGVPLLNAIITMFRYFRIVNVKVRWYIVTDNSTGGGTTDPSILHRYCYDVNQINAPYGTSSLFKQQENVVRHEFNANTSTTSLNIKPRQGVIVTVPGFPSTFDTGYTVRPKYISTTDNTDCHFGYQWCFENIPTGFQMKIQMDLEYTIQFKGQRAIA